MKCCIKETPRLTGIRNTEGNKDQFLHRIATVWTPYYKILNNSKIWFTIVQCMNS